MNLDLPVTRGRSGTKNGRLGQWHVKTPASIVADTNKSVGIAAPRSIIKPLETKRWENLLGRTMT